MIRSVSPAPVHPSPASPRPCPTASKAFSEHVRSKTRAATSGHSTQPAPSSTSGSSASGANASPTPTATPATNGASSDGNASSVQSSLDQSEDQNMQFLQIQSEVNDQSETFTTLSNVMKTENDTLKNTAANMAI